MKPWYERQDHCFKRENDCLLHDCLCRCVGCDPRGVLNDAAPELYEALEAVVASVNAEALQSATRTEGQVWPEWDAAEAALKKARGGR